MSTLNEPKTARALQSWLTTKLRTAADITVSDVSISQASGGATFIHFTAAWTDQGELLSANLVAKVAATGPGLVPPDVESEFGCLLMLAEARLPGATPWWFEVDSSVLGGPFLILEGDA